MTPLRLFVALPALVAALTLAPSARADVPPPQECGVSYDPSLVGTSCNVAGPQADEPGVCTAETCGEPPDTKACILCEVPEGGAAATSGSSSHGCSMSPLQRDGALGVAMLALGVGVLARGRRLNPRR